MLVIPPGAGAVPGDPTPPEITPTIVGTLGAVGWYRSNVTVNWSITDPESIILGTECVLATTLTVDTPGQRLSCRAWSDGGDTTKSVTIKIDKNAPTVSAQADRAPDANGWYNRLLTVSWSGTDATSGMDSCTSAPYAGPDNPAAVLLGSCRDVAGNQAATVLSFKYDATPPTIFSVTAKHGNRSAQLSWRKSADTKTVEVLRAPGRNGQGETAVYRGSATGFRDTGLAVGRKYQYRVIGIDEAANRAERRLNLVGTGALFAPLPGARVTKPPNLVWTPVRGATYYNLQLIRGDKVLSAWPTGPHFRLRRTWTYRGRRHRLRPGVYRWYVWPGLGRISAARYGQPLGSSTFVVTG
ncbi:MAG TPA: hypothetical protein VFL61_07435 [Gaiellaceae bacterium]|nr:hypothetical protein [Gaiellaceae bacterium]